MFVLAISRRPLRPNELIAWKTARSAAVQHAGVIRFEPLNNGGTRLHMRMSYNPPGGALGDAIASLFGADLKSELDADLIRIQTFLETGRVARDAARQPEPVS